jgi:hypothetical protein
MGARRRIRDAGDRGIARRRVLRRHRDPSGPRAVRRHRRLDVRVRSSAHHRRDLELRLSQLSDRRVRDLPHELVLLGPFGVLERHELHRPRRVRVGLRGGRRRLRAELRERRPERRERSRSGARLRVVCVRGPVLGHDGGRGRGVRIFVVERDVRSVPRSRLLRAGEPVLVVVRLREHRHVRGGVRLERHRVPNELRPGRPRRLVGLRRLQPVSQR